MILVVFDTTLLSIFMNHLSDAIKIRRNDQFFTIPKNDSHLINSYHNVQEVVDIGKESFYLSIHVTERDNKPAVNTFD
jgi:hypothetical protein